MNGVFRNMLIVSAVLFASSSAVALKGWYDLSYQPTEPLILARQANWQPLMQTTNDRVFDLKVEAGIIPAPVS
ncbi:MAG: hypothetical protein MUF49_25490 [Oculatellaceae cyanobacterium Prado106]|jgi:hypothetical protein|nr:hypothetical protein [Oculatellaceae cyanobacterium Prado106]